MNNLRQNQQWQPTMERTCPTIDALEIYDHVAADRALYYFGKQAEKIAEEITTKGDESNRQLRMIYDAIIEVEKGSASLDVKRVELSMILARVTYRQKRPQSAITNEMLQFLKRSIEQIKTQAQLSTFRDLLEAVYAYHYQSRQQDVQQGNRR